MKTKIFIFFILVFNTLFYQSQNTGITYQALIINPQGEMVPGYNNISAPLANKDICMRFSIYDSSNQAEYVETIKTTTDKSGIVNLIIGTGSKVGGYATSFSGVLWDKNLKRLKVEFDVNANCSDYLEISNQTFSYVPFAYYSSSTKEATATTTGSVQLAGDLAGVGSTAKSPKITDGAITSSKLANGAIINSKIGEIISVNNGGTGNSNIIGYVVGNGTNAMTGVTSIPVTDVDGAQTVSNMDADIATSTDPENKYPSVKAVKNYIGNSIAVSTIPDASTTAKGKLQLSGDLSGTADSPSIALGAVNNSKLADDAVTASKIKDGEITDAKIANGISASKVGLGNVNNTSDTSKPISTLQQAALDLKENLSNKSTDITADATSTTKYPAVKTIKDYVDDAIASATIADADATTKGKLQLAGDLTGSAAYPAIAAGAVTTAKIADAAVTDDKIDTVSGSKITGNIPGNAENVNGIVSIANGGTGSSTQNFVDLSTDQTIAGAKTFNSDIIANGVKVGKGSGNGDSNVAVGTDLGSGTGYRNTGVGAGALQNFSGTSFGNNTGIGYANMQGLTTGYGNTSLGGETLASVANNDNNTAIGNQTLRNAASSNNTALGANAGNAVTTGSGNTLLGSQADLGTGTNSNATAIGYGAVVNGDNTIQLGNTNITSVKTSGKLTTGTVTYPNTNGTGSQFLKTDGNGNAEWADLPAIDTANLVNSAVTDDKIASGISASKVGLGNVNNTADADKPISTAQQTALDLKENLSNKSTDITADAGSSTKYPTVKAIKDYVDTLNAAAGVADGSITSAKIADGTIAVIDIADNAVETAKIKDANVTTGKLANSAVTTAKIADANITYAKIQDVSDTNKVLGRVSTGAGSIEEISTTGSGNVVRATSPTLVTPTLGVATATSFNKLTITAPTTSATLTVADGKTLTVSNDATVSGTNTGDQTITLTGDVTGTGTGSFATTLASSGVTAGTYGSATEVPTITVDAKGRVTSASATTITGVSPIGSTLSDGKIIIGDSSSQAAAVAVTGDVTLTNAGVTTIGASKVVTGMIADGTITVDDMANDAIETAKIKNGNVTNAKLDKANIPLSGFGAATADVALGGKKLTGVADPTSAQDAATKSYVDTLNAAAGVADGSITSAKIADGTIAVIDIADNAVETAKIKDANVTTGKLANSAVTTAKIADANITYAKIQDVSDTNKVLGRVSTGAGSIEEISTTGSGNVVRATSPTLVTPNLGTPSAIDLTNATNLPLSAINGTLGVEKGGTGLTSLTAGQIPFGNGTNAFGNSANLFWDNTNSRLGINTSSPSATFQIGTDCSNCTDNLKYFVDSGFNTLKLGYRSTGWRMRTSSDSGVATDLRFSYDNGSAITDRMIIGTSGNISIPGTLDVTGNAKAGTGEFTNLNVGIWPNYDINYSNDTRRFGIFGTPTAPFQIYGDGDFEYPLKYSSVANSGGVLGFGFRNKQFKITTTSDSGVLNNMIYSYDNGTTNSEIMRLMYDGTVYLANKILITANAASGKVLTSDANGYATWGSIPATTTSGIADSAVTSAKIADGTIADADVSSSAAIAFSKLNIAKSDIVGLGIPSSDSDTTYTAGTGVTLTGTAFSIGQDVATTASPTFAKVNKVTITAPSTGSTLTIADGKTLTANNSIILAGTDGKTMTFPSTDATIARTDAAQTFTGTQTFSSTIAGSISGNAATVTNGIYTTSKISDLAATTSSELSGKISDETGSGALVFANTPTLVTPNIGAATGTSLSVSGQLTSTVATGTAPLVVTSTTPVANLSIGGNAATVTNGIYTTSKISDLAATTSSELSGKISDETGSGALVFANTPTLVTPNIGAATGTSLSVSGQLTSTVATGTAPLVVTSTTPVANLSIGGNAATATTATNIAGGAAGSLPYQTAAGTTSLLAAGNNGQVLTLVGGVPAWTSGVSNISVKTGSYTLTTSDKYIIMGTAGITGQTFTLPTAAGNSGKEFIIKNVSAFNVSVATTSSQLIIVDNANSSATSVTLGIDASNNWIKVISDGTSWYAFRALF